VREKELRVNNNPPMYKVPQAGGYHVREKEGRKDVPSALRKPCQLTNDEVFEELN